MEAVFKRGMIFRKIIESFRDFIMEGNLFFLKDSITLQAMDMTHVSLVYMELRNFGTYRCAEPFYMGMHITHLHKILKCMDPEDTLTLSGDPDHPELAICFENTKRTAEFGLNLIDLDAEQLEIPDQEYDVNMVLTAPEFKRVITDLQAFGESIVLSATIDGFQFQVKGDTGSANVVLKTPEEYTCQADTVAEFSMRHLVSFARASVLSSHVTLRMSADSPLVVEYTFDEGRVRFYLSPKIND
jgi:proliferating cell nuclear antigen (pcna)